MTRLAFFALLLMAFAPVASRWMASRSIQLLPGFAEMCAPSGVTNPDSYNWGGDRAKLPAPDHSGMDADCAYCPLLAGTALLLPTLVLPFPRMLANLVPVPRPLSPRSSSLFPGLGSRGPPLAL